MNAKDLLTALNDIDPKLLEDVEPWGEPAQPLRRRPLWAVAAGLVLTLGLGTGGLFLAQHLSAFPAEYQQSQEEGVQQDSAAAQAVVMPELEFESFSSYTDFEENCGLSQAFYAYYADYVGSFFSGESHEGEMPDLTEEQLETIWGAPLPWDGLGDIQLEAYSAQVHDTCLYAEITGRLTTEVGSLPLFSAVLIPQQDAQEWEQLAEECVSLGNNQVQGIDIAAFEVTGTDYYSPQISPEQTSYLASFALEGENPVLAHFVTNAYTESDAFSKEDAQELLNALVEQSIRGGISLEGLEQGASAGLELSFTSRPATDNAFSNVWNTFAALYLEHSSMESSGVQRIDGNVSEEDLRSVWSGKLPWEEMLTENDTVTAVKHFSEEGDLIQFSVYGHRDSPEIPGTQAYPLFNVTFYNTALTGEWGQAAENVLALADTTFQGVDIATQRTESRMDYEDGTSMDFSDYGALFQPEQGPALISVDGFYSPVAFTRETAQSFVEQVTEEILTHGVDLSGITGAP